MKPNSCKPWRNAVKPRTRCLMMTVTHALEHALALGLPRGEVQMLLLHCLGHDLHDRAWLLTNDHLHLSATQHAAYDRALAQRLQQVPVAYLTGEKAFYGLRLHVDARVLDPRPDTETLVDWALACLPPDRAARLLDLGTGSGAIALAIKAMRPQTAVWAVDVDPNALAVAQANATALALPVTFVQSDWWGQVRGTFEVVVSNPPYIAQDDPHLAALASEPAHALVAGVDGLDALRQIVQAAPAHLVPEGWLLLEHGHDQADAVGLLLAQAGFVSIQSRTDLAGIRRCTGGQWRTVDNAIR